MTVWTLAEKPGKSGRDEQEHENAPSLLGAMPASLKVLVEANLQLPIDPICAFHCFRSPARTS